MFAVKSLTHANRIDDTILTIYNWGKALIWSVLKKGVPIVNIWWRRAVAYILRIILPASLLSQLVGSVFCGRSSPRWGHRVLDWLLFCGRCPCDFFLVYTQWTVLGTPPLEDTSTRSGFQSVHIRHENGYTRGSALGRFRVTFHRIPLAFMGQQGTDLCR